MNSNTKFIDMRGKLDNSKDHQEFAFYDIELNRFLEFNLAQVWSCWDEFYEDFREQMQPIVSEDSKKLEKLESIIPEWAKTKCECEGCRKKQ